MSVKQSPHWVVYLASVEVLAVVMAAVARQTAVLVVGGRCYQEEMEERCREECQPEPDGVELILNFYEV